MYTSALLGEFRDHGELVALCDLNQTRMDYANRRFAEQFDAGPVPTYRPAELERMIRDHHVDTVIVTTIDRTHHEYISRAMTTVAAAPSLMMELLPAVAKPPFWKAGFIRASAS